MMPFQLDGNQVTKQWYPISSKKKKMGEALVQTIFLHFRESILGIPLRSSIAPPAFADAGLQDVDDPISSDQPTQVDTAKSPTNPPPGDVHSTLKSAD